jgi:photosystem II stability/assembly factor-like uncharacterized protein
VSILTSTDGGHTWVRHQGTALDGQSVLEIVVDPTNANVAWAATGARGVFRTADGGTTWTAGAGLETASIMSLAVDPSNPTVLYAGTVASGVVKSTDGGVSWLTSSIGMDPAERVNALVVDPSRPTVVYAGTNFSGVYVSVDAGATWTLYNTGLDVRVVQTMAIAADGNTLYAGTGGGGVFGLGPLWSTPATLP